MALMAQTSGAFQRAALDTSSYMRRYMILAAVFVTAAVYIPDQTIGLGFLILGLIFLGLVGVSGLIKTSYGRRARQADEILRQFLEDDTSLCLIEDEDGQVVYKNVAARDKFGSDPASFLKLREQIVPGHAAGLRGLRDKAHRGQSGHTDVAIRGGALRVFVKPLADGNLLWRFEAIPERAQAGRSIDSLSVPMMAVSKAGTVLYMNDALRRLLGGRRPHLDRVVNDLPLVTDQIHELAGQDGPIDMRAAVIEGALGRREVYFLPVEDVALRAGAVWSDFENLPVALLQISASGVIQASNATARILLGIGRGETPHFADLVEGLGRSVTDWLARAADGSGQSGPEFVQATRHSKDVFLQVSLSPLAGSQDRDVIAVISDATELKTLEAQFVQSQKMQAIGQLAGGIAHDFNNLLTAISGHCDLLMLRHDELHPDYSDLVQIHQNANRAASLVGQLLAFSRKQTLKPEVLDVTEAMDDLAHLLGRLVGEKVSLETSLAPELPHIRADKRQLEQVIMNLVVNARDAMPDGGSIRVETRLEELTEPYCRDNAKVPPGRYVVIQVTDEGVGIPPDKIQKIFEPFFTTKRTGEGTGLGLSMAYGIVKQTGGFIFVDSVVGAGTGFTLFFQAHDAEAVPIKPITEQADNHVAPREDGVVLLVEDEAPVRAFASRALKMRGFTVVEADSAEQALERLEDPELKVDVFVTDVIMPGRDGPSWVAEALQKRPDTRVVFISGYAEDSIAEQQARIPNSVFLPKPFSLSELTATVGNQYQVAV